MADSGMFSIPGFSDFSEIGSGGFATVYAATEDIFERRVAIKVLRQGLDASDRRRFERECQAMARLSDHPNVVTLYSAGYTEDDRPFIVMELVTEGSLSQRLEETGSMDWLQVQNIGIKVADALARAHEVGVLHRDIKPANILMVGDEPKLSDFGIASFLDSAGATSTNIAVSWSHAPPETFENIRDERSDVYSLGSTLHTLLTGTPPFSKVGDDSVNTLLNRLLNKEPAAITRPDVPQGLRRLIWETLRKNPNDRPQTAELMNQRLREIEQSEQVDAANTVEGIEFPPDSGGSTLAAHAQSGHMSPNAEGQTAEVSFRPETPAGGSAAAAAIAAGNTAPHIGSTSSNAVSKATSSVATISETRRKGQRAKVGALVSVALVLGIAGTGSAALLSRSQAGNPASDTEVAAPIASEALASPTTGNVASDEVTSSQITQPTESTARLTTTTIVTSTESSPTTGDGALSKVTQRTESTAGSTTTATVAATEPPQTTRPAVTTLSTTTTSTQPTSSSSTTSTSSPQPAPLATPDLWIREVTDTSFWVQWAPVESAFWYPFRVTIDGEEVLVVDNTSACVLSRHSPWQDLHSRNSAELRENVFFN